MSKKANPTVIGLFVVIGLALAVGGVLLFSSSRLFSRTREFIMYFDSSLNGLNIGAPVKYRGVAIGSVRRMMIRFNQATNDLSMPVMVEIQENLLRDRLENAETFEDVRDIVKEIKRGLRASLASESLVTGVLYVELDTPADPPPPVMHQLKPIYEEIPTRHTDIQELMKNLASLDIKGLEEKLGALLGRIDVTLGEMNMGKMSSGITNVLYTLNRVISPVDLTNTLGQVERTLAEYQAFAQKLNHRLDPVADSITNTLAEATQTLNELRGSVQNLRSMLAAESPLRNDLGLALEQLASAAQSISALAEFLKRHPNSLLTGRQNPDQKP
jgi:paraquat-inducible protein B